ncbi:PRC-barrel domain-containing protein [Acuticoccus sp.]|uniref:PRC-barrel domain-containing protein n=1 Tax=Acuticoccus sp. TaxID=1904378 RepID=UPI003B52F82D
MTDPHSPIRRLARTASIAALLVPLAAGGALAQVVIEREEPEETAPNVVIIEEGADAREADREDNVVIDTPAGAVPDVDFSELVEIDEDFVLPRLNLPVYALDDYDIVDRNGEDVGEIEKVLGPNENTATMIVVEFDGPGFLFDHDVPRLVDLNDVTIEGDNLVIDIAEDEVRRLTVYED